MPKERKKMGANKREKEKTSRTGRKSEREDEVDENVMVALQLAWQRALDSPRSLNSHSHTIFRILPVRRRRKTKQHPSRREERFNGGTLRSDARGGAFTAGWPAGEPPRKKTAKQENKTMTWTLVVTLDVFLLTDTYRPECWMCSSH